MYIASRDSVSEPFGTPERLDALEPSNGQYPSISADGLTLYFQAGPAPDVELYVAQRASRAERFTGTSGWSRSDDRWTRSRSRRADS